jgi:hypothetical protein
MPITYTTIATTTFASASTSYTFNSIPSTYTDLVLVMSTKFGGSATGLNILLNGDSGSNYAYMRAYGYSATISSEGQVALTTPGSIAIVDTGMNTIIANFQNYKNTNVFKSIIAKHAGNEYLDWYSSLWASTAAINSIQIYAGSNFDIGTNFTLYGITAA